MIFKKKNPKQDINVDVYFAAEPEELNVPEEYEGGEAPHS